MSTSASSSTSLPKPGVSEEATAPKGLRTGNKAGIGTGVTIAVLLLGPHHTYTKEAKSLS